jgi:hypothetical protein
MRCLPEVMNGFVMRANTRATASLLGRDRPPKVVRLDGKPFTAAADPAAASAPGWRQEELSFPDAAASLWTFAETAIRLRVPERTLRLLVSRHKPPVIKAGRRVLFDEIAINHLIGNLRCPSKSPPAPKAPCSGSRGPSAANAFERALALTTSPSPKKSGRRAKLNSTGVRCTA